MLFFSSLLVLLWIKPADSCAPSIITDPQTLLNLFRQHTSISPFLGQSLARPRSTDLSCQFDSGEICAWDSAGNIPWRNGEFGSAVTGDIFSRFFQGKSDVPNGPFLFAGDQNGRRGGEAILQTTLPCTSTQGTLSLRAWTTSDNPSLDVCVRSRDSRDPFGSPNCQRVNLRSPNPFLVTIPQSPMPTEVSLRAYDFTNSDLVILDDLVYSGGICDGGNDPNGEGREVPCDFLECDFDSGSVCEYDPTGTESENAQWNFGAGKTGNPASGPRVDARNRANGGYAYAGQEVDVAGRQVFVLESPEFSIKSPAELQFDVYSKTAISKLEVCLDDLANCPYETPDFASFRRRSDQSGWLKGESMQVPTGKHKILFVTRDLTKSNYLGVDNVRFNSRDRCTKFGN